MHMVKGLFEGSIQFEPDNLCGNNLGGGRLKKKKYSNYYIFINDMLTFRRGEYLIVCTIIICVCRKNQFQSTSLPVMPGMISRPTSIPSMGNLQELYPETFGGVSMIIEEIFIDYTFVAQVAIVHE